MNSLLATELRDWIVERFSADLAVFETQGVSRLGTLGTLVGRRSRIEHDAWTLLRTEMIDMALWCICTAATSVMICEGWSQGVRQEYCQPGVLSSTRRSVEKWCVQVKRGDIKGV